MNRITLSIVLILAVIIVASAFWMNFVPQTNTVSEGSVTDNATSTFDQ